MADFRLRAATTADLPVLTHLLTDVFHRHLGEQSLAYWFLRITVQEDLRVKLRAASAAEQCWVAIAPDDPDARPVGYVELDRRRALPWQAPVPYLSNLAIAPEWRRQGIATALLGQCEQVARGWGCDRLQLHVLATNVRARGLYDRLAFTQQRIDYGWDHWLLGASPRLLLEKRL